MLLVQVYLRRMCRAKIREAEKALEEARRMIANDPHHTFTSKQAHFLAEAQYACGKAYDGLGENK